MTRYNPRQVSWAHTKASAKYPQRTEPLSVPAPYQPRCRLRLHIPHYPQPNPNPVPTLNLTLTAQRNVFGYWMTSRLRDQSPAQCNRLCTHWVHSGSVPRHYLLITVYQGRPVGLCWGTWYLILDGVGLKKLSLSIAPLFTWVQMVLEVINRSCRHNVIRKRVPMFDCPLAKEVWPDIDATLLHLKWILMPAKIVLPLPQLKKVFLLHSFPSYQDLVGLYQITSLRFSSVVNPSFFSLIP